jgi:hypothetical protein
MVDQTSHLVEVWTLNGGSFVLHDVYGPDHEFQSAALGGKTIVLKPIFAVLD